MPIVLVPLTALDRHCTKPLREKNLIADAKLLQIRCSVNEQKVSPPVWRIYLMTDNCVIQSALPVLAPLIQVGSWNRKRFPVNCDPGIPFNRPLANVLEFRRFILPTVFCIMHSPFLLGYSLAHTHTHTRTGRRESVKRTHYRCTYKK